MRAQPSRFDNRGWNGRPSLRCLAISPPLAALRKARKLAASRRSTIAGRSQAILWPRPGVTRITDVDVPLARDGQVTVEVAVSVVSPGTERARFLALENARVSFPHFPGYQAAGHVTHDPASVLTGRRVAVRGAAHQRLVTVPTADVREVPSGVDLDAAAAWPLGLTALYGLTVANAQPVESVAVVGSGLLGVLVRRLAAARGASRVVAVSASEAKRWTLDAEPSTEFIVASDPSEADELGTQLVIDATGTASGLLVATAIAPNGGVVILLGSPRCDVAPFPVAEVRRKQLHVVGAHIETMQLVKERTGVDPEPALTAEFFDHLRSHRVSLTDLLSDHLPPAHAASLYRRLAADRHVVGASFDWTGSNRAGVAPDAAVLSTSPVARSEHSAIRFGLLGCGDVGLQNAAAIFAAAGAELRVCFDPVDRLADDVRRSHGAEVAPSWEAVLERDDIDAVFVATPHDRHETLVIAAIAAEKHVVVEKPLAADLAAAARIAAAARQASTTVTVCLPMRDDPCVVAARQAIDEGLIGVPHGLLATYLADKPPSYYFGGFSSRAPSTWRLSKERSGGGVLIMNLVHHLDMARHLLGREASSVRASTLADAGAAIEDLASVIVDFDGVVATFVACSRVVEGAGDSLRLWGDVGQIQVLPTVAVRSLLPHRRSPLDEPRGTDQNRARRTLTRLVARISRPGSPVAEERDDEFERRVRFLERVVSSIARGEQPEPSVDDGFALQALVSAAYEAAAGDRVVRPADLIAGLIP